VFEDTGSEAKRVPRRQDNPVGISTQQALDASSFVLKHRSAPALVVHCTAGVSRSRSLAAAVATVLGLPYQWTVVNDAVYRAVSSALASELRREQHENGWAEFDDALAELRAELGDRLAGMTEAQIVDAVNSAKRAYRRERRE
jgi:protein-tyrosine phosphatase